MHPNTHHIYPLLPRVPLDLGRPERPSSSSHPIQVELCPASSDFCAQITLPLTSEASHRLPPSSFGPSLADQEGQSVVLTGITETLHTIQEKLHEILDTRVSELNNHRRISNELHLDGISEMNGQSPKSRIAIVTCGSLWLLRDHAHSQQINAAYSQKYERSGYECSLKEIEDTYIGGE
ncbi:hypothetical protein FRC15_002613 [Serendipita sp. 397]|nr:hypothetical protein FRC15_002613 [Serendipita sp. 397]